MNLKKRLSLLLPLLLLIFGGVFFLRPFFTASSADERFITFTSELFRSEMSSDTLSLHYLLADPAAYGISADSASFDFYSKGNAAADTALLENAKAALQTFSRQDLSPENQKTYDILSYQLNRELELAKFDFYEEIFSPTLGIQAQLPILLAEYAFRNEQDIKTYLALLSQLDTYYQSLLNYQEKKTTAGRFMSDETADLVIAQCQDFIANRETHFLLTTFEERLSQVDFLSESARKTYLDSNQAALFSHVFPAYELLSKGLAALKGCGENEYGLAYFDQGRDYYQALIACNTGSERSPEEMIALVDTRLGADFDKLAKLISSRPELLTSVSRTIDAAEPARTLELLEQKIRQDFPEMPAASYEVKYVTPALENYLSPAFYLTPPLDLMQDHVIYINPASNYDNLSLFTTLAHEGYPGHLYQTLYENSCGLNPVRNLFYFGGYVEGWATYIEQYAYTYPNLEPDMATLLSANNFLSLGLHARADLGIHYEGWTPTDTLAFFASYGITDESTVDAIYQAILQDPGNYLKYYLGALEMEELKQAAEAALGDEFVLKEFHEFVLSMGPAPFPVIREYMDTEFLKTKE